MIATSLIACTAATGPMRIEQEIVLGHRRRACAAPSWNQADGLAHQRGPRGVPGAGARARLVQQGLDFDAALEAVAANTVFTTHTPVPAGHDHFSADMMCDYFSELVPGTGHEPSKSSRAGPGDRHP